ncbi:hypothetical protein HYDPIDRAFT_170023 [Hydnomerulius pinastri MD-312]|uniref:Uncharacterized protein n=1 Tax=Hydnomerulius pinastri MD-312 TaxID=994086 RepID=A0A0C9W3P5_9AGAM|nr:hypothetical protein HYDPIDRAFT_170023 [Hydnomerulius pinastri MD-312]
MNKSNSPAHARSSSSCSVQACTEYDGAAYLATALSGMRISKRAAVALVQALEMISDEQGTRASSQNVLDTATGDSASGDEEAYDPLIPVSSGAIIDDADLSDDDPEATFFGTTRSVAVDDGPPSGSDCSDRSTYPSLPHTLDAPATAPAVSAPPQTSPAPAPVVTTPAVAATLPVNVVPPIIVPGPGRAVLTGPPGLSVLLPPPRPPTAQIWYRWYRGYVYHVPQPGDLGPFYCVTKGLHVGVFSVWQRSAMLTQGVSGAIHSKVKSLSRGIDIFEQMLELGGHSSNDSKGLIARSGLRPLFTPHHKLMGRPLLHHTPEDRVQAARAAHQRYYTRNREKISQNMKEKYRVRKLNKEIERSLAAIEDRLMILVDGSLKSFVVNLCGSTARMPLGHTLENLILKAAEIQFSAWSIEGEVLQAEGVGKLLTLARSISRRVATVITTLEDLLLADMEGQVESLYRSNGLLYQTTEDICYGNSMTGSEWASKEQKIWLQAYYEKYYVPCMPSKNYTEFKPVFYEAWFKNWPMRDEYCKAHGIDPATQLTIEQEGEIAEAVEARKGQLLAWMRWQGGKARKNRAASKVDPFKSLQALVVKPKGKRNLSEEQVFSKLFYDEKVKDTFELECAQRGLKKEDRKERMGMRRKLTSDGWKEAARDQDLRERVLEEKARRDAQNLAERQMIADEYAANREQKEKVIKDLPAMLNQLLESLQEKTDWSFTLLAGDGLSTVSKPGTPNRTAISDDASSLAASRSSPSLSGDALSDVSAHYPLPPSSPFSDLSFDDRGSTHSTTYSQYRELPPRGVILLPAPNTPRGNASYRQREASVDQDGYLYDEPDLADPYNEEVFEHISRSSTGHYFSSVPTSSNSDFLPSLSSLSHPPPKQSAAPEVEVQDSVMRSILLSMPKAPQSPLSRRAGGMFDPSRASQVFKAPVAHPPGYHAISSHIPHSRSPGSGAISTTRGQFPDAAHPNPYQDGSTTAARGNTLDAITTDASNPSTRPDASTPGAYPDASTPGARPDASALAASSASPQTTSAPIPNPAISSFLAPTYPSSHSPTSPPSSGASTPAPSSHAPTPAPSSRAPTPPPSSRTPTPPPSSHAPTPPPPSHALAQATNTVVERPERDVPTQIQSLASGMVPPSRDASVALRSQENQLLNATYGDASAAATTTSRSRYVIPAAESVTTVMSKSKAVLSSTSILSTQQSASAQDPTLSAPLPVPPVTAIPTPPAINVLALSVSTAAPKPVKKKKRTNDQQWTVRGAPNQVATPASNTHESSPIATSTTGQSVSVAVLEKTVNSQPPPQNQALVVASPKPPSTKEISAPDIDEARRRVGRKRSRSSAANGLDIVAPPRQRPVADVAPRRSGRGSIPSSRNAVANEIGGFGPRGGARRK